MRRIAVKVGSNVLTRADGTLDFTRMSALTDQIADLCKSGIQVILISSGAVASGRSEVKIDRNLDSVSSRQLFSSVGQTKLMNRYYELFGLHGMVCGQVLTTKDSLVREEQYCNQRNCMEVMLECGVVPIVNENDTISITELMFTDNDELSGLVATMMKVDMLVILSNIDGLYDGDPLSPEARVIPQVLPGDDVSGFVRESRSTLGRGGMSTKCHIARSIAEKGIPVVIANGKREDILLKVVAGDRSVPYTCFPAKTDRI